MNSPKTVWNKKRFHYKNIENQNSNNKPYGEILSNLHILQNRSNVVLNESFTNDSAKAQAQAQPNDSAKVQTQLNDSAKAQPQPNQGKKPIVEGADFEMFPNRNAYYRNCATYLTGFFKGTKVRSIVSELSDIFLCPFYKIDNVIEDTLINSLRAVRTKNKSNNKSTPEPPFKAADASGLWSNKDESMIYKDGFESMNHSTRKEGFESMDQEQTFVNTYKNELSQLSANHEWIKDNYLYANFVEYVKEYLDSNPASSGGDKYTAKEMVQIVNDLDSKLTDMDTMIPYLKKLYVKSYLFTQPPPNTYKPDYEVRETNKDTNASSPTSTGARAGTSATPTNGATKQPEFTKEEMDDIKKDAAYIKSFIYELVRIPMYFYVVYNIFFLFCFKSDPPEQEEGRYHDKKGVNANDTNANANANANANGMNMDFLTGKNGLMGQIGQQGLMGQIGKNQPPMGTAGLMGAIGQNQPNSNRAQNGPMSNYLNNTANYEYDRQVDRSIVSPLFNSATGLHASPTNSYNITNGFGMFGGGESRGDGTNSRGDGTNSGPNTKTVGGSSQNTTNQYKNDQKTMKKVLTDLGCKDTLFPNWEEFFRSFEKNKTKFITEFIFKPSQVFAALMNGIKMSKMVYYFKESFPYLMFFIIFVCISSSASSWLNGISDTFKLLYSDATNFTFKTDGDFSASSMILTFCTLVTWLSFYNSFTDDFLFLMMQMALTANIFKIFTFILKWIFKGIITSALIPVSAIILSVYMLVQFLFGIAQFTGVTGVTEKINHINQFIYTKLFEKGELKDTGLPAAVETILNSVIDILRKISTHAFNFIFEFIAILLLYRATVDCTTNISTSDLKSVIAILSLLIGTIIGVWSFMKFNMINTQLDEEYSEAKTFNDVPAGNDESPTGRFIRIPRCEKYESANVQSLYTSVKEHVVDGLSSNQLITASDIKSILGGEIPDKMVNRLQNKFTEYTKKFSDKIADSQEQLKSKINDFVGQNHGNMNMNQLNNGISKLAQEHATTLNTAMQGVQGVPVVPGVQGVPVVPGVQGVPVVPGVPSAQAYSVPPSVTPSVTPGETQPTQPQVRL